MWGIAAPFANRLTAVSCRVQESRKDICKSGRDCLFKQVGHGSGSWVKQQRVVCLTGFLREDKPNHNKRITAQKYVLLGNWIRELACETEAGGYSPSELLSRGRW